MNVYPKNMHKVENMQAIKLLSDEPEINDSLLPFLLFLLQHPRRLVPVLPSSCCHGAAAASLSRRCGCPRGHPPSPPWSRPRPAPTSPPPVGCSSTSCSTPGPGRADRAGDRPGTSKSCEHREVATSVLSHRVWHPISLECEVAFQVDSIQRFLS